MVLKAELAGMDPDDIEIEVEDNVLTIKGERKFEEKVDDERYYRVERRFGSFQRSLALPQGVKPEDISRRLRGRHPHRDRAEGRGGEAQAHRGQGQEDGRGQDGQAEPRAVTRSGDAAGSASRAEHSDARP